MGLHVGNMQVKEVYVGSTPVKEMYVGAQKVWPTSEVYEISMTELTGTGEYHSMLDVTVPAGETWTVTVQGTISIPTSRENRQPKIVIGSKSFGPFGPTVEVNVTGTVTSKSQRIAIWTNAAGFASSWGTDFTGTVTIEK